jgi:hypothetical protein
MKSFIAFCLPALALAAYHPTVKYESGQVHNMLMSMKRVCDKTDP